MKEYWEPIYLNEAMVWNCATYLSGGMSLESLVSSEGEFKGGAAVGIPLARIGGEYQKATAEEVVLRATLHGKHMELLERLRKDNMLHSFEASQLDKVGDQPPPYVEVEVVLKPVDFHRLLELAKAIGEFVSDIPMEFLNILWRVAAKSSARDGGPKVAKVKEYGKACAKIADFLLQDYLQSGQLEMVMYDPKAPERAVGLASLDLSERSASQLRAKLSGGRFRIVGKVAQQAHAGDSISLLQNTMLSAIVAKLDQIARLADGMPLEPGSQTQGRTSLSEALQKYKPQVEKVMLLSIPGPAVRILVMSVCL